MHHEPPVPSPASCLRAVLWRVLFIAVVAGAVVASLARDSRAEQFVLFDATFDYTWDDAVNASPSKSHYYINDKNWLNTARPKNWLSPVDYRNGLLHVRAEVFKKPAGDQATGWTICYIPNSGGYGCADTTYYKAVGVWERETKMTAWWNNDQLQWQNGVKQIDLIYAINDSGSGHITNYPQLKDLTTPTRVRITLVQVSAGSTYDPSILATLDGGVPASADSGAGTDATPPRDGGSTTGSGGASGSGGATTAGSGGADGSGGAPISSSTGGTTGSSTGTGGSSVTTKPPGVVSGGCAVGGTGGAGALAMLVALGMLVFKRRR